MIGNHTILIGDVVEQLRTLPDESVQCVVTSPPYWALRDYGVEGQLGLEPTPQAHVAAMVAVFDEVRRVLRTDGTCWVNYGDCYYSVGERRHGGWNGRDYDGGNNPQKIVGNYAGKLGHHDTLKPKDLVGVPWRFAFAMQDAGWWLRSDIIWHKPNPMPESCTDRPRKSHEYLFLFTKAARYFYDAEAIREVGSFPVDGYESSGTKDAAARETEIMRTRVAGSCGSNGTRNARTVWTIATQPYSEAHFATFPEELPRRCVKAGTSERGACAECGAPWGRDTDVSPMIIDRSERTHSKGQPRASGTMVKPRECITTGWSPTCTCDTDTKPRPCMVLDPFAGSGTTLAVACGLGRDAIGIEINPEYAALAEKRIGKALRPSTYRADEAKPAPLFGALAT